jgi:hypothetical protein
MRRLSILAAALAAAAAWPAHALTCYSIIDRTDSTVYQDTTPPFDLSTEGGAAARNTLRSRNEFLVISETDRCPLVSAPPGTTGYQPASVDEIVAGITPYGAGARLSTPGNRGGGNVRSAPAPASARSGSSGMRSY